MGETGCSHLESGARNRVLAIRFWEEGRLEMGNFTGFCGALWEITGLYAF